MYPDIQKFKIIAEFISKDTDKYFKKLHWIFLNNKKSYLKRKFKSITNVFWITWFFNCIFLKQIIYRRTYVTRFLKIIDKNFLKFLRGKKQK